MKFENSTRAWKLRETGPYWLKRWCFRDEIDWDSYDDSDYVNHKEPRHDDQWFTPDNYDIYSTVHVKKYDSKGNLIEEYDEHYFYEHTNKEKRRAIGTIYLGDSDKGDRYGNKNN